MLRKERRRAKDRLSVTESVDLDEPAAPFGGFAWYLGQAEAIWRPHASDGLQRPEPYALAWYADAILCHVALARAAYAAGMLEQLALAAFRIGRLHEEGRWRPPLVDANNYLRKVRAKSLRAGRRRGREVHGAGVERDRQVIELAAQFRQRSAYARDKDHSTRWLARAIARRLDVPWGTIYGRLVALGIR